MIPCSSPRSSGWRATDWIIDPRMLPMPMPAPTAPRPTPRPKAIAWPCATCGLTAATRDTRVDKRASLVLRLDRRADVDRRQRGEDERLNRYDDDDFEDVEEDGCRQAQVPPGRRVDDEDESDHDEDQHVAGEHVREESDGERDQAHEHRNELD